jgi:predicted XRE-type DNA-binding protein
MRSFTQNHGFDWRDAAHMAYEYVMAHELRLRARSEYEIAKAERGVTQQQIADALQVRQSSISEALSDGADQPFTELLIRIIAYCGPFEVRGPMFRIEKLSSGS